MLDFLKEETNVYVKSDGSYRRFIEGIMWISRSGAPLRMLPAEYGKWYSVYRRFCRWNEQGIGEKMHLYFSREPDMEPLKKDRTTVRVHPCAAGAPHKRGQRSQALGRSRGGFSTKVQVLTVWAIR